MCQLKNHETCQQMTTLVVGMLVENLALLGTHPVHVQSPPILFFSISTTRTPSLAAKPANTYTVHAMGMSKQTSTLPRIMPCSLESSTDNTRFQYGARLPQATVPPSFRDCQNPGQSLWMVLTCRAKPTRAGAHHCKRVSVGRNGALPHDEALHT